MKKPKNKRQDKGPKLLFIYNNKEEFDPIAERLRYLICYAESLDENYYSNLFYNKLLEAHMYWCYFSGPEEVKDESNS